jgi:hypothetical protein
MFFYDLTYNHNYFQDLLLFLRIEYRDELKLDDLNTSVVWVL